MDFFTYLFVRRLIIAVDEWLSYVTLIIIYYKFNERRLHVMLPIICLVIVLNGNGYYHLELLENRFNLYGKGYIWSSQIINSTFGGIPSYLQPP
jgi:hypothetical protein